MSQPELHVVGDQGAAAVLSCSNSSCGRGLFGAVPFCPYCGTAVPKSGAAGESVAAKAAVEGAAAAAIRAAAEAAAAAASKAAAETAAAAKREADEAAAAAKRKSDAGAVAKRQADEDSEVIAARKADPQVRGKPGEDSSRNTASAKSGWHAAAERAQQIAPEQVARNEQAAAALQAQALKWFKAKSLRRAAWFCRNPRFKRALLGFWILGLLMLGSGWHGSGSADAGAGPSWMKVAGAGLLVALIFVTLVRVLRQTVLRDLVRATPELAHMFVPPVPADGYMALVNQEQRGPFSSAQLRAMLTKGQIDLMTMLWRPGLPGWLPAGLVPGATDEGPLTPRRLRRLAAVLAGEFKPPVFATYGRKLRKTQREIGALPGVDPKQFRTNRTVLPQTTAVAWILAAFILFLLLGGSLYTPYLLVSADTPSNASVAPSSSVPQPLPKPHPKPKSAGAPGSGGGSPSTSSEGSAAKSEQTTASTGAASTDASATGETPEGATPEGATPAGATSAPAPASAGAADPSGAHLRPAPYAQGMLTDSGPLHALPDPLSATAPAPADAHVLVIGQTVGTDGQPWLALRVAGSRTLFVESARSISRQQWSDNNTVRDAFGGFVGDSTHVSVGQSVLQLYGINPAPGQSADAIGELLQNQLKARVECKPQTAGLFICITDQNRDIAEFVLLNGVALTAPGAPQRYFGMQASARERHKGFWSQ